MLYQLSYSRPYRFGICDCGFRIDQIPDPNSQIRNSIDCNSVTKSQIRNPKSEIKLVQGVGFEPTYGFRRPGLQPGAINHSTTLAHLLFIANTRYLS